MGLLKWLADKFSCTSDCTFNNEFLDDLEFEIIIDLLKKQYEVEEVDLHKVHNIIKKRPSKIIT